MCHLLVLLTPPSPSTLDSICLSLDVESPLLLSHLFSVCLFSPLSSSSIWLWQETTALSVCGATAGPQTPWTTAATTLCPAPSTLGKNPHNAPLGLLRSVYQHLHTYAAAEVAHFICLLHKSVVSVFCAASKESIVNEPCKSNAGMVQGCGIAAVLILYTLHYSHKITQSIL